MIYEDTTGMYELMLISEMTWNTIIEEHMKLEYSSIIYEDTKLLEDSDESFFAKLKSFFLKLLTSLKNIFRITINNIRNLIINNKKFVDNARKTIKDNYSDVTIENVPSSMIVTDALQRFIIEDAAKTKKNFEEYLEITAKITDELLKDGQSQTYNQMIDQYKQSMDILDKKIEAEMASIQNEKGYTINGARCLRACSDILIINKLYDDTYKDLSKKLEDIIGRCLDSCNRKEKFRIKLLKKVQQSASKGLSAVNKNLLLCINNLKKMVNYFISKAYAFKNNKENQENNNKENKK